MNAFFAEEQKRHDPTFSLSSGARSASMAPRWR